jgi:trimeric autotransporter adhesin
MNHAGTVITASSAAVTLVRTPGSGSGSVTCTTNPLSAGSGVATFAGCKMSQAGGGLSLTASAAGITSAVSNTFTIS